MSYSQTRPIRQPRMGARNTPTRQYRGRRGMGADDATATPAIIQGGILDPQTWGAAAPAATPKKEESSGAWDVLKSIGGALIGGFNATQSNQGKTAAYQQYLASQQPATNWLPIVAIGGVGILAVVLLMDRK